MKSTKRRLPLFVVLARTARRFGACLLFLLMVPVLVSPSWAVTIPTVQVGNAGNAGELQSQGTFGAVAYGYRISTTEVTNAQYVDFLNAKAASDPLGLYNSNMGSDSRGGISRSGVSGSFTYATKTNMGNKPVNYVSWYDAIRFANWLHNNQGIGDTETGAYTVLGGTPTPSNGPSITRNGGVSWALTSENEWYKAAYHQPTAQGGDADDYWLYPTASNSAPTIATAIDLVDPTRGDIGNPAANVANYNSGADWNSVDGNVTTVGSAGPLSDSFYGTSDQGGNVFEWNEALIGASNRSLRGGSLFSLSNILLASNRSTGNPTGESSGIGFRVTMVVPEPSTAVLGMLGAAGLLALARRRNVDHS